MGNEPSREKIEKIRLEPISLTMTREEWLRVSALSDLGARYVSAMAEKGESPVGPLTTDANGVGNVSALLTTIGMLRTGNDFRERVERVVLAGVDLPKPPSEFTEKARQFAERIGKLK